MPLRRIAVLALIAVAALPVATAEANDPAKVRVMTRNIYLGATLTPGLEAKNFQGLVDAAGTIIREVDANRYDIRVRGLANEIKNKKPDLVGLQEAAHWRQGPCNVAPTTANVKQNRWNSLRLLMAELNDDKKLYRVVISKPEFDFAIYANMDGNKNTHGPGCPLGAEINGRLTMRDVILARVGRVETSNSKAGTFDTLLAVKPAGVSVDVTRGWTATTAKVKDTPKFRFVNTHFEAFDNHPTKNSTNKGTEVKNGEVREAQAKELVGPGGPANHKLKVILLGDLNSDIQTEVKPGDSLAYRAVRAAGFKRRAAARPFSCCLETSDLRVSGGGELGDFDHNVDHILTDAPSKVKLLNASGTGRQPRAGFWNSDHRGLFSTLQLP